MTKPKDNPMLRGFAVIDKNVGSAISAEGGRAAHAKGTAHKWTSEEAKAAGRKGGLASMRKRRAKEKEDG
jgi:general stress protein YciG